MARTPGIGKRITDEQAEREIREFIATKLAGRTATQPSAVMSVGHIEVSRSALVVLGDAAKRSLKRGYESDTPAYGCVIERVLDCMQLKEDEREQSRAWIIMQIDECIDKDLRAASFVDFLRIVTLRALLPIIRLRAEGYFYKQGASQNEISELGEQVDLKVLKSFRNGTSPNGNAGAYMARICKHVWFDHCRKARRNREILGLEDDLGAQAIATESHNAHAIQEISLDEIDDPKTWAIAMLFRYGWALSEIAVALGSTVSNVRRMFQDHLER